MTDDDQIPPTLRDPNVAIEELDAAQSDLDTLQTYSRVRELLKRSDELPLEALLLKALGDRP